MHVLPMLILGVSVFITGSSALERIPVSPFGLFAYGDGIGGAPVFTTGDGAYIGKASHVDDTEAAEVQFVVGTDNSLLGNPNTTAGSSTPSWSNLTLIVPDPTSSSHQVEFTNSTPQFDRSASGFIFYGHVLLHKNIDGELKSLWYAVPSAHEHVWALNWNSTGDNTEGQVIVTLKATPPSKEVDKNQ